MADVVKNFLAKPTAIVHSSNDMSVTERKIFNILLRKARSSILNKATHSVDLSELIEQLGFKNYTNPIFFKESLLRLANHTIRLNLIGKDKKVKIESAISILSRVDVGLGKVHYTFSKEIINIMAKPSIYAYINLDIQRLMSSKHSMALWEFCTEQLDSIKAENLETSAIPLASLKELLGAHGAAYNDFRYFKRDVIEKAINEVNNVSDLAIQAQYIREGRSIAKIKFNITRSPIVDDNNQIVIPDCKESIIEVIHNSLEAQDLEYDAQEIGIIDGELQKLLKKYNREEVKKAIECLKKQIENKVKIRNKISYLYALLANGIIDDSEIKDNKTLDIFSEHNKANNDDWGRVGTEIFQSFCSKAKEEFSRGEISSWISRLTFISAEDDVICFSAPSNFIKSWIETNYMKRLLRVVNKLDPKFQIIKITV